MGTCFSVKIENNIAHVDMCRPDRANSMIPEFWKELPATIQDINENARARVIVLSGQGKHFCSGMDISVFAGSGLTGEKDGPKRQAEIGRVRAQLRENILHLQDTFTCLEKARMPVLAAIQGACVGGGVDMSAACDMRYATRDAFFCIQEINIGMMADVGTYPRICGLLSQGMMRELAYTGRRMYADEAKSVGLVNHVFESHEDMMEEVMRIAAEIASKSPLAIQGTKELINYSRDHTITDSLDYVSLWQSGMFHSADMSEAFTSQRDKRDTNFDDLLPLRRGLGSGV